ncbi:MAG: hypothetical protein LBT21_07715 [Oscillospiraceae bacterium]|jgi:hypothetical protein|nr:hypothetical protein [Oscillospiraceae bacterium]
MKKRISKRISVLLVLTMVLTMLLALPMFASAAPPEVTTFALSSISTTGVYVQYRLSQVGKLYYIALDAAASAPAPETIKASGIGVDVNYAGSTYGRGYGRTLEFGTDYLMYYVTEENTTELLGEVSSVAFTTLDIPTPFPLVDTFALHSKPDSNHTIYLDFDGHVTSGLHWNTSYNGGNDIITPAYSIDDDPAFNKTEKLNIQYVFQRVREDFLPFDVDVTTEEPPLDKLIKSNASDVTYGVRVAIGGASTDWYGAGAGGVATMNSFAYNSDTPCFAFAKNLQNNEKYMAEAVSHEVGHTLGLSHDGTPGVEYYQGANGWASIMGVGYYEDLTQWSKGEYEDANNQQDDLAIIATKIPYRPDDHGNNPLEATALTGNPLSAKGIIEQNTDQDFFYFTLSGKADISLKVNVAERGANLDVLAKLSSTALDDEIVMNDTTKLTAEWSGTLPAGTYYLSIEGTGKEGVYSDYGSLGEYGITVAVTDTYAPELSDLTAANIWSKSARVTFSSDEGGTLYSLLQPEAAAAPDAAQVKAGTQGTAVIGANELKLTALEPETEYTVYLIVGDAAGNDSAIASLSFTTAALGNEEPGTFTPENPDNPSDSGGSSNAFCNFWQRIVDWFKMVFSFLFGWAK